MHEISYDDLEHLGACPDARDWFLSTYGEGPVPVTEEGLRACNPEWVDWLALQVDRKGWAKLVRQADAAWYTEFTTERDADQAPGAGWAGSISSWEAAAEKAMNAMWLSGLTRIILDAEWPVVREDAGEDAGYPEGQAEVLVDNSRGEIPRWFARHTDLKDWANVSVEDWTILAAGPGQEDPELYDDAWNEVFENARFTGFDGEYRLDWGPSGDLLLVPVRTRED